MTDIEQANGVGPTAPATLRFPLTAAQTRFWYLDKLRPGDLSLNVAVQWELRGEISRADVESAFAQIFKRHEILRTRFIDEDGLPYQEVLPEVSPSVQAVQLSHLADGEQAERLSALAAEQASQPFDMSAWPLLRATLAVLEQDRAMLLIVAHHAIFDGFSIGVLGREFGAFLGAALSGQESGLEELPLQYGDYALWQAEYLASGAVDEDRAYWKSHLKDLKYFELTPDFERPTVRSADSGAVHADLPREFSTRLADAAKANDTSQFTIGAGALAVALHRVSGASEIVMGTQVAGRDDVDLESLIGVFINNLVLRVPARPDMTIRRHLSDTSRVVRDALAHQHMPFNKLVELLRPTRDLSRSPLVSVSFNLQRTTFMENRRYERFEIISRPSHTPGTLYDFNIMLIGRPDGCRLTVEYSKDLFKRSTAERLLKTIIESFEAALSEPEKLVGVETASTTARVADLDGIDKGVGSSNVLALSERRSVELRRSPDTLAAPASSQAGSDTKERLAKIWSKILGLPVAQCDDDFFRLGGHSLMAIRMLAQTRNEWGKAPGIGEFLAAPNLDQFAAQIDKVLESEAAQVQIQERSSPTWELMELRSQKELYGPVIVTINHPIFYYMLANNFSASVTVANLRIPNADSVETQSAMTFDAICAEAAAMLKARYPARTIVPLGLCVNGRVGLLIAQKLRASGTDAPGVAMIDTWAPGVFAGVSRRRIATLQWKLRARRWMHYVNLHRSGRIERKTSSARMPSLSLRCVTLILMRRPQARSGS
ncbi:MAG: condensation domain-containing protein [Hyphomicrobiaceae bacterium]